MLVIANINLANTMPYSPVDNVNVTIREVKDHLMATVKTIYCQAGAKKPTSISVGGVLQFSTV